jgi:Coenzyme F420-dependent N5,N10-methylene tetrahydromethanopterin reductase and related flavin-dependent oxidoreductases
MNKGIFSIPVHKSNTNVEVVLNEVFKQTIKADEWGLKEAFFGEHITDKHEKIASSLMMVASLSKVTKKIKLGSLTTNLNFFNPATAASLISMVDNLTNGRLILGVGSGANMSDVEAINSIDKENHSISLESLDIIKKLLNSDDLIDISSKNFKVSTKKFGSKKLGLGYFNGLYNQRDNLEIVMPALIKIHTM